MNGEYMYYIDIQIYTYTQIDRYIYRYIYVGICINMYISI